MKNVLDMFRLDGKVALVTGGSGKYGSQIVLALLQAGADVWVASRTLEKNVAFAEELKAQGITHFISVRDNVLETLKAYLKELGI